MRIPVIVLLALCASLPARAQDLTGTLAKIKDTGKVVVGFQEASVPFSYLDDKQVPVGFAMDICEKIVDALRQRLGNPAIRIETNPVTSSTRIPLMVNGTVDLVCSATTNNVDRQRQVAFTNTHFLTAARYAAKKASGMTKVDDLKGKAVVAVAGSIHVALLNELNARKKLGMKITAAKDQAEAFLLLDTDRAAAFVVDDIQLAVAIAGSKNPSAYVISEETLSKPDPLAIMLRKGDAPFKAVVDQATADLYRSPGIAAMYAKWFEQPVPPRGLNFNSPMSPELRRAFAKPSDSADPSAYD